MKKVVCLLLCLILIIPAAGSLAYVDYDKASFTVTLPAAGTTAANVNESIISNFGGEYYAQSLNWTESNFTTALNSNTVFEEGKSYYFTVQISLSQGMGYAFTDTVNVTLKNSNGAEVKGSTVKKNPNNHNQWLIVNVMITIPVGPKTIDNVALTIKTTMAGTKISQGETYNYVSVPNGANYARQSAWWCKKDAYGNYEVYDDNERLLKDNTYMYVCLSANGKDRFSDNPQISVTGGTLVQESGNPAVQHSNTDLTAYYKVNLTGEDLSLTPISKVEITITPPDIGKTAKVSPPAITLPSGMHYSAPNNSWAWTLSDLTTPLDPNTVFEVGETYYATVMLQADNGYEFIDYPSYSVTGGEEYNCMPVLDTTGRYNSGYLASIEITLISSINQVSATVTPPAAGSTAATAPVVTIPSGSNYYIDDTDPSIPYCIWLTSDLNILDSSTVFSAGETYLAMAMINANNGFVFADPVQYNITNAQVDDKKTSISPDRTAIALMLKVTIPGGTDTDTSTQQQTTQPETQTQQQTTQTETQTQQQTTQTETPTQTEPGTPTQTEPETPTEPAAQVPQITGPVDIGDTQIEAIKDQAYTGKKLKPKLTITYSGMTLAEGTDYTLSYKKNKDIGKAEVTVKGKGTFTGSRKVKFNIVPKSVKLSKLKAGKKMLTVKWKKGKNITGYQIEYSLNADFSKSKTITVSDEDETETEIKKLKKKKTYYVRVRTFTKVGSKKYYSEWSAPKSQKTK